MPNNVNAGLSGAVVSLLAHLRSQARKNGDPAPDASAAPGGQAVPGGQAAPAAQVSAAAPKNSETAVRFDFSGPQAQAAATLPSAPPAAAAVPLAAYVSAAAPSPMAGMTAAADPAPGAAVGSAAAAGAETSSAGIARAAGQKEAGAAPASPPARRPEPAALDDEAMARAWAIRTVARENTLNMIGRIARIAEPTAPAKAADNEAKAPEGAEPKTLARV